MAKFPFELTRTTLPEWSSQQSLPNDGMFSPESDAYIQTEEIYTMEQEHGMHEFPENEPLHEASDDDDEDGGRLAYRGSANLDSFDIDQVLGSERHKAFGSLDDVMNEVGVPAPAMVNTRFVIDPKAVRGVQTVHKLIGVGTFSEVYHCSFKHGNGEVSEVALKLFDQYVRLEETESAIMANLHHPNLVGLHEVIVGLPCGLVIELCPGGSLQDFLHGEMHREIVQSCSVQARLRAMHGIACALHYLHSSDIIHRDVKSGNCLLSLKAEYGIVPPLKLGDLGFAREVSHESSMTRWRGTVRYMAPEMIESSNYDVSVDIFSFGILLHELLSGQIPYSDMIGVNEVRLAIHVCAGRRPSLEFFSHYRSCAEICSVMSQTWDAPANRPTAYTLATQIEELIGIA